jgi:hypothetical protein
MRATKCTYPFSIHECFAADEQHTWQDLLSAKSSLLRYQTLQHCSQLESVCSRPLLQWPQTTDSVLRAALAVAAPDASDGVHSSIRKNEGQAAGAEGWLSSDSKS